MSLIQKPQERMKPRTGVTIVEVLTSIIVAVIGVAGVLVLIPFGIRQASVGLDLEDSTELAENALTRFELEGYNQIRPFLGNEVLPWVTPRTPLQPNVVRDSNDLIVDPLVKIADATGFYFIDPLWINAQFDPMESDPDQVQRFNDMFVYLGNNPNNQQMFREGDRTAIVQIPPFQPRFVSLQDTVTPFESVVTADPLDPVSVPITISPALAARLFVNRNGLEFAVKSNPVTGLDIERDAAPMAYLDFDGGGNILRRQSRGEISWSGVAVAKRKTGEVDLGNFAAGTRGEGFDFFVLVYKNRSFENPTTYRLFDEGAGPPRVNSEEDPRILYSVLDATTPNANPDNIFGSGTITLEDPVSIQNDEWIMLVNYDLNLQAQVGFFRVVGSDPNLNRISLDGSDFIIEDFLTDGTPNRTQTYALYLPDVISVHKRQLSVGTGNSFNNF